MHKPILHWERKTILKTVALGFTLWALPGLAAAADLVVGVVHDIDGYPVAAATVTLKDAAGIATGSGTTAGDGTFAIDAAADATRVEVHCAYCVPASVSRVPGAAVVVLVRRFAALRDRGISAADARVLPYASVVQEAALLPFTVSTFGWISDRGLANALGTIVADGFGLYRATDGVDLGEAIPAHGAATIQELDPAQAAQYGSQGAGGLFSIDTLDQSAGLGRVDASSAGDVVLRAGNALNGVFESNGGAAAATRGMLAGMLPAAGGTLDLRAVSASGMRANANAFATTLVTPLATAALTASLSLTRSSDGNGPENDQLAALSLQSGAITYGLRAQRSIGAMFDGGMGATDDARAFIQAVHDDGHTRLFASLAAAQSGETYLQLTSKQGALLPVLGAATHLGADLTVHADSIDALIAAPLYLLEYLPNGTGVDRSHLIDAGLRYDDANRFRIDAMVFRETVTGTVYGTTGGSGISAIWQIAPALALRSWVLISHDNGSIYSTFANLDRNSTWLTAGNVLRVDAIWRGGVLEGDASVPLGHARFVAGTRRDGPNRIVTAGLSWP